MTLNNKNDTRVNIKYAQAIINGLSTYTGDVQEIKDLKSALA